MSRSTISHADQHFAGAQVGFGINNSKRGAEVQLLHRLLLEAPPAGDVDGLILPAGNGAAGALGLITQDGALVNADGVGVITGARNISAVSSNVGDTTQTLTITGRDAVGNLLVADLALNGTTEVVTASAFSAIDSVSLDAVLVGNLSLGTSVTLANIEFGLQGRALNAYDILHTFLDTAGTITEVGTVTLADVTSPPTAITGDARGTLNPTVIPDGALNYLVYYIPDYTKEGYGVNFTG